MICRHQVRTDVSPIAFARRHAAVSEAGVPSGFDQRQRRLEADAFAVQEEWLETEEEDTLVSQRCMDTVAVAVAVALGAHAW